MKLHLTIFLFLLCSVAYAQINDLTAQVIDTDTNEPIPNVAVTADSVNWTFTNSTGFFSLKFESKRQMILISSIGYRDSQIRIPQDQISVKMQMTKEYAQIEKIDIGTFGTVSQLKKMNGLVEETKLRNKIIMNAEYPGGLRFFLYDLAIAIKSDSAYGYNLLKDTVVKIKFTIDNLGKMKAGTLTNASFRAQFDKWFSTMRDWRPAIQNNTFVPEHYEMPLTWSSSTSKNDPTDIYSVVEESAMPSGGLHKFYKFVEAHLKYPAGARKSGIEGKVFVEFVVERSGKISDVKVLRGIGGGCDEEAVRVIKSAPDWLPGTQRGNPVRQKMVLPISFGR